MKAQLSSKSPPGSRNSEANIHDPMQHDLHELFLDQMSDMLNAERQLTQALPKFAKAASSRVLRETFTSHLRDTKMQVVRLEKAAKSAGEALVPKVCRAMRGLLEEADEILEDYRDSDAVDAALIAAAQKIEHYEIATYGTLVAWAEQMGHDEAGRLLRVTLSEEKDADAALTEIADVTANVEAEAV